MTELLQQYARAYNAQGWGTVKLRWQEKRPYELAWQTRPYRDPAAFAQHPGNLGVQLGHASGGLVDVDLDCPEAVDLAPQHLPFTPAKFGRASKPRSHWLYYASGPTPAKKFYCDKKVIIELRGDHSTGYGGQTAFPPSIHPSGEAYTWEPDADTPAGIAHSVLLMHVEALAAAICAARGWSPPPAPQSRPASCPRPRLARGRELPPIIAAVKGGLSTPYERPEGIEEGARDDELMRYAGHCFGRGMSYDKVLAKCVDCNDTFDPPMEERQVLKIVNSIAKAQARKQAQQRANHDFLFNMHRG
jgi:Bifunctional DNA primase/polymerase, N-terminal/Primase C terminal 1 (PriCT-1)